MHYTYMSSVCGTLTALLYRKVAHHAIDYVLQLCYHVMPMCNQPLVYALHQAMHDAVYHSKPYYAVHGATQVCCQSLAWGMRQQAPMEHGTTDSQVGCAVLCCVLTS